jgi:hypothetical protein
MRASLTFQMNLKCIFIRKASEFKDVFTLLLLSSKKYCCIPDQYYPTLNMVYVKIIDEWSE